MMMWWWFKWFVIGSLATGLGYYRYWTSQLVRTCTAGSSRITDSLTNDTDVFQFINQSQQSNRSYLEFEHTLYANGLCGNIQVLPSQRPCTPPPHVHLNQTEYFTVLQGNIGYQIDDNIYSCDKNTCPRPISIQPLQKHTFWMDNNKEDLILLIGVEPISKQSGIRREFFENYIGVIRDHHNSIWQIFVLFDNAQTYSTSLPLPLSKIIVKLGALIGQLLGYKIEYEEYTTIEDDTK